MANFTRDEAIKIVGRGQVIAVEALNCEPTNRLQDPCDNTVEYKAGLQTVDQEGYAVTLSAVYYPSKDDLDANADDLGGVDWQIYCYEIV
jgi:hypothetical protein